LRAFITGELTNRQTFSDWQVAHFNLPLPPEAAPDADPDADGASNFLEFVSGTNPLQAGDAWGIDVAPGANGVALTFQNPANRAVIIETATSIPPNWTPVDHPDNRPVFPAVSATRTITDSVGTDQMRLYRARLITP
jgi:hypothetical protein